MYLVSSLLENLRQQTETNLQKAIEWQMRPTETLEKKPAPGKWNAAQCLEHLNFYSRHYQPAMEKAMNSGKAKPEHHFKPGWLGAWFTRQMEPRPDGQVPYKMQAPAQARPSETPDARAVLAEFIDHQEHMLRLIEKAEKVSLSRLRVPISIATWIRLKLGDTFLFMAAHHRRHLLQAERAMS
jgi:hypothetical protein